SRAVMSAGESPSMPNRWRCGNTRLADWAVIKAGTIGRRRGSGKGSRVSPVGSRRCRIGKPLVGRGDLGDEIADERLVAERLEPHLALFEPRRAGIDRLAVDEDHAFLACIGVDAGKAEGEARILLRADAPQPVEHGLAGLERHGIARPARRLARLAAADEEGGGAAHCAPARAARGGTAARTSSLPSSESAWLTRQASSVAGKSSRRCAP